MIYRNCGRELKCPRAVRLTGADGVRPILAQTCVSGPNRIRDGLQFLISIENYVIVIYYYYDQTHGVRGLCLLIDRNETITLTRLRAIENPHI